MPPTEPRLDRKSSATALACSTQPHLLSGLQRTPTAQSTFEKSDIARRADLHLQQGLRGYPAIPVSCTQCHPRPFPPSQMRPPSMSCEQYRKRTLLLARPQVQPTFELQDQMDRRQSREWCTIPARGPNLYPYARPVGLERPRPLDSQVPKARSPRIALPQPSKHSPSHEESTYPDLRSPSRTSPPIPSSGRKGQFAELNGTFTTIRWLSVRKDSTYCMHRGH